MVPLKMHGWLQIGLPKIYRRFRSGLPKCMDSFVLAFLKCMDCSKGPTSGFQLNLLSLDFYSRGILVYHGYYARKAKKSPI